jgi:hypothetical protein
MRRLSELVCLCLMVTMIGCTTHASDREAKQVEELAALTAKYLPGYTLRAEDRGGSSPAYLLVSPDGQPI